MTRTRANKTVITETDDTILVEGNHYFPVETVNEELLIPSPTTTTCPRPQTGEIIRRPRSLER